jgi:hypothetical protein
LLSRIHGTNKTIDTILVLNRLLPRVVSLKIPADPRALAAKNRDLGQGYEPVH